MKKQTLTMMDAVEYRDNDFALEGCLRRVKRETRFASVDFLEFGEMQYRK
jgi:hypothetical protein